MTKAKIQSIEPILQSQDVSSAVGFYTEKLGFKLHGYDNPEKPMYAVISRDGIVLHIQWHDPSHWEDDKVDRPMLRFVVPEIELLFEEFADKGVFHEGTALRETPWGTKEFAFFDADLNGLTFYKDV